MVQNQITSNMFPIRVSAPGRIVFAGDYLDIFSLHTLSAAINLRIEISGKTTSKSVIQLNLHNMRRTLNIPLRFPIAYRFRRSYLQSGLNNLHRAGYNIPGFEANVVSHIPQNAGLSSSSALCVAWAKFLLYIADPESIEQYDALKIAEWAHKFEVKEFNEPGGKQDHLATALGGINYIQFPINSSPIIEPLQIEKKLSLVIGHSLIRKNTLKTVFRIRNQVAEALKHLYGSPKLEFLHELHEDQIPNRKEYQTLKGIITLRDLTQEMKNAISLNQSLNKWGELILEQHRILRDKLQLSLPRIERMIQNSLSNGAYGAKISGSGEGGCMFALCEQEDAFEIAEAIQKHAHGSAFIVTLDEGVKLELS
ncbi:MAG: hypothetical protein ACFFD1_07290 [Candidatus Thorarchaeota archaeon]